MTTHENNIPAQGTTLLNAPEITAALPVSTMQWVQGAWLKLGMQQDGRHQHWHYGHTWQGVESCDQRGSTRATPTRPWVTGQPRSQRVKIACPAIVGEISNF